MEQVSENCPRPSASGVDSPPLLQPTNGHVITVIKNVKINRKSPAVTYTARCRFYRNFISLTCSSFFFCNTQNIFADATQRHNFVLLQRLLQGVSIACYVEPCINYSLVVCPSVCPSSVTRWHSVKTTQARITIFAEDSPRTLVLAIKRSYRNCTRFTPSEGVK